MNTQEICASIKNSSLITNVDTVKKGHIRIQTGFCYPDGSSIDIFIPSPTQNSFMPPALTDFGNTIAWLDNMLVKPYRQPKRKEMMDKIMNLHGCSYEQGVIEYPLKSFDKTEIEHSIINIGQACARLSDLVFGTRYRALNDFDAEVQDRLSLTEYDFEQNYEIPRRDDSSGKIIKLDFLVKGKKLDTGIMTLSSPNKQQALNKANEIYVRWDDMDAYTDWQGNRLTIYNDNYDYGDQIMERLERKSILIAGNDNDSLQSILDAA
jgi:Domain of unknown function DUF1828